MKRYQFRQKKTNTGGLGYIVLISSGRKKQTQADWDISSSSVQAVKTKHRRAGIYRPHQFRQKKTNTGGLGYIVLISSGSKNQTQAGWDISSSSVQAEKKNKNQTQAGWGISSSATRDGCP